MPTEKYKLLKADGANGAPPPCAFFLSAAGCRNGDNCKFSHAASTKETCVKALKPNIIDDSSDVVSSESEDEVIHKPAKKTPVKQQKPSQNDNKNSTNSQKKRKRNTEDVEVDENLGMFCKPKRTSNKEESSPMPPPPQTQTPKSKPETPKQSSFRSLGLPTASFTDRTTTTTPPASPKTPSFRSLDLPVVGFKDGKPATPSASAAKKAKKTKTKMTLPIPQSTPEGKKWQNAVIATRDQTRYPTDFNFDRMKKSEKDNIVAKPNAWVKAQAYGSWCSSNPHAIAIDCEMCETKDPKTGKLDPKALCRISVVNAVDPDDVLIDTLVKPDWPVTDYRARINGITKEDLENVQFTLSHAQEFMMALCSEETVIIGHAVHNDLEAIRMEHHCNVDSALLFKCKDEEKATCSLRDLAKSVMGKEMPNIHCSINDARTSLVCLEEGYLKKEGKPDPVERSYRAKRTSTDLFVHRIPKGCKSEHLKNMIFAHTNIAPEDVPDIIYGTDYGKTTITFTSVAHANIAFQTLEGEAKPDKTGRMQKRIYMRNGDYTYVRKMTMDKKKTTQHNAEAKAENSTSS
jgi:RNA exonuclease 1